MYKKTGLILLAAGASRRMGTPKQLLPMGSQVLIEFMLAKIVDKPFQPVAVVLGANAEKIKPFLPEHLPVIFNKDWQEGMGRSVASGFSYFLKHHPEVDSCFIILVDQPYLKANMLESMWRAGQERQASIVAARYGNTFGAPVLFDKKWFLDLTKLEGDSGAKKLIYQNPKEVLAVDFPKGQLDLDTPEDYKQWLKNNE